MLDVNEFSTCKMMTSIWRFMSGRLQAWRYFVNSIVMVCLLLSSMCGGTLLTVLLWFVFSCLQCVVSAFGKVIYHLSSSIVKKSAICESFAIRYM